MKLLPRIKGNIELVILAIVMLLFSIHIYINGTIWTLQLIDDQRVVVSAVFLALSLFILYLLVKGKGKQ